MYSKAELGDILAAARHDPRDLIELLTVKDERSAVVPFKLNEPQEVFYPRLLEQLHEGYGVRIIVLKARQVGISTLVAGFLFVWSLLWPRSRTVILAQERKKAVQLKEMYDLFATELPARFGLHYHDSKDQLRLLRLTTSDGPVAINSSLFVDTAKDKEVGRSETINFAHLSEAAFYQNAEKALTGVMGAVHRTPQSFLCIESTANGTTGIGGPFYERWRAAKRGESNFIPIFLPWFGMPSYRLPAPEHFEPTEEEEELITRFGVDFDQLLWRRDKIGDLKGDVDKFRQEFPCDDEEAFLMSGTPAFPKRILFDYRKTAETQTFTPCEVKQQGRDAENHPIIVPVPTRRGRLRVFEPPDPRYEYCIGVDTALGVEGGDMSAIAVLNRTLNRFVATFLTHIDPVRLGQELWKIGWWYNLAIVAVEVNGTGLTTQTTLIETCRYPRPWRWRKYDNMSRTETEKVGWETSWRSRPMLIDSTAYGLREHLIGLPDVRQIDQLTEYDSAEERPGKDDLADATLIAWHIHLRTRMKNGRYPQVLLDGKLIDGMASPQGDDDADLEGLDPVSIAAWRSVKQHQSRSRERQRLGQALLVDTEQGAVVHTKNADHYVDLVTGSNPFNWPW